MGFRYLTDIINLGCTCATSVKNDGSVIGLAQRKRDGFLALGFANTFIATISYHPYVSFVTVKFLVLAQQDKRILWLFSSELQSAITSDGLKWCSYDLAILTTLHLVVTNLHCGYHFSGCGFVGSVTVGVERPQKLLLLAMRVLAVVTLSRVK